MNDESYIKLALEIAKKGKGKVSPNPLVGAVLVKNDKIIGAGFHQQYGGEHAEINAIRNAKGNLEGASLYVNLEPCSHFGKTPPCVDEIIKNKIKRVVIGTMDMNPLVCGNGIKKLKEAGVEVKVGVLENECVELNRFFFKFITKKTPYVTLKAAITLDGKIAGKDGDSKWISSLPSRRLVHSLRSEYDAVLIGKNTVIKDDPNLTVRLYEGRNPKRIVMDKNLELNLNFKIFKNNKDKNLIVITSKKSAKKTRKINELRKLGVEIIFVREKKEGSLNLKNALKELSKRNFNSILVEGGRKIFTSFLKDNLFDDILVFVSPKILGAGTDVFGNLGLSTVRKAPKLKINSFEKIGDDIFIELVK